MSHSHPCNFVIDEIVTLPTAMIRDPHVKLTGGNLVIISRRSKHNPRRLLSARVGSWRESCYGGMGTSSVVGAMAQAQLKMIHTFINGMNFAGNA